MIERIGIREGLSLEHITYPSEGAFMAELLMDGHVIGNVHHSGNGSTVCIDVEEDEKEYLARCEKYHSRSPESNPLKGTFNRTSLVDCLAVYVEKLSDWEPKENTSIVVAFVGYSGIRVIPMKKSKPSFLEVDDAIFSAAPGKNCPNSKVFATMDDLMRI